MGESPVDYYVDALLRTLDQCEKIKGDKECSLYLAQLSDFCTEYCNVLPPGEPALLLLSNAQYYKMISNRALANLRLASDRNALESMLGPRAALRHAIRKMLYNY